MPNSAKVNFREIDQSFGPVSLLQGIAAVSLQTLRGPYGHNGDLITSWAQFSLLYGGEVQGMEGPTQAKRALERGAILRVNKQGHYTDVSNPNTLDAGAATFAAGLGEDTGDNCFDLTLKNPGVDYNNLSAVISAASNGNSNSWNLAIIHSNDSRIDELYENLTITGTPTIAASDYLDDVIAESKLVNVTYNDCSGFTGPLDIDVGTFAASGGTDGGVASVAQVDTVTLSGTSGNANMTIVGGLTKDINFNATLNQTATDFVTDHAAAYLAQGIVVTDATGDIIFTASTAGTPFEHPVVVNTVTDLAGTNVPTTPNTPGGPTDADYAGNAGGTGFYAFNGYNDFNALASLDRFTPAAHIGGAAYSSNRADLIYYAHIDNVHDTTAQIITERTLLTTDTRFLYIIGGGLTVSSPFTDGATIDIPEVGDVIGAASRSDTEFGPWFSFAGPNRGIISNALGVVNNFGNDEAALDSLANRQTNMVIERDGRIMISGNFSGQLSSSKKSFVSVVKLIIYLKKTLRPLLEGFIEEPNDFRTFREIYNSVNPFLENLEGQDKRALVDQEWRGDQFANSDTDLVVNTRAELDQGKYKVELYLKEVVSLQEFTVDIISTSAGITFEENF